MNALPIILLLLLFKINANAQDDLRSKDPKTHKAVLKRVRNLPETKEFFAHTSKTYEPTVYVNGPASTWNNYWWVKVGISNFDQLRTTFDIMVDPKTLEVYYLDNYIETDAGWDVKMITLQQWRKWRVLPAWRHQIHHYKNGKFTALAK